MRFGNQVVLRPRDQFYSGTGDEIASPGTGPFFDTFTGDGNLSVRTGWGVQTTTALAAFANVLSTSSGNVRSTNAAAAAGVSGYHPSGGTVTLSRGWYKATEAATGGLFEAHGSIDATNGRTAVAINVTGALNADSASSTLGFNSLLNGANTNRPLGITHLPGFVLEVRTVNDSGTTRAAMFANGRRQHPGTPGTNATTNGIDVAAALGRAANGNYGFSAGINNPQGRMFGCSNGSTDAWISLISPAGVRQSGKTIRLRGEYSGARAPLSSEMSVSVYTSADAVVSTGTALSNFSAAGGYWTGTIPNPETDNVWYMPQWTFADSVSGLDTTVYYPSPTQRNGDVYGLEGQSQVEFIQSTAGDTLAAPASASYSFNGQSSVSENARILSLVLANKPFTWLVTRIQAYSARSTQLIITAKGGSSYADRNKPSAQYTATLEAYQNVGAGKIGMIVLSGGTSAELTGNIYDNIIQLANDLDADLGEAQLYGIMPEGNRIIDALTTSLTNRRGMWKLTNDFPSRFKLVGWRNELQHDYIGTTGSPEHYATTSSTGYVMGTTLGVSEHASRIGDGIAFHMHGGPDYRGPRFTSSTAPSKTATTVRIYFQCGDLDGLTISNTGFASDFRGGFRFNSASNFAGTDYAPTNATFGTVTGGIGYVEWTFASLPSTVYVDWAQGENPFNRTNVVAINQNMQGNASVLQGTKTGVTPRAVWPSYDVGGTGIDYLTIS